VVEHASGTSDFIDTGFDPGAGFTGFPFNPQSNSFTNARFLGGVQAGYNWQFNPQWLVGVEGDWDWAHTGYSFCRITDQFAAPCFNNGFGFENISSKTDWLATVRGRLGFVWGNWLFYGTGGAAWGRVNTTVTLNCLGAGGCGNSFTLLLGSSTASTTAAGWVAGAGAEWMLARNWSVRAEWLHIDLGTISDSVTTVGTPGIQTAVWSRTERYDEFRVGANYLFH
jgi:outer membrane immunogenic protein